MDMKSKYPRKTYNPTTLLLCCESTKLHDQVMRSFNYCLELEKSVNYKSGKNPVILSHDQSQCDFLSLVKCFMSELNKINKMQSTSKRRLSRPNNFTSEENCTTVRRPSILKLPFSYYSRPSGISRYPSCPATSAINLNR